jgi:hypothetical protein
MALRNSARLSVDACDSSKLLDIFTVSDAPIHHISNYTASDHCISTIAIVPLKWFKIYSSTDECAFVLNSGCLRSISLHRRPAGHCSKKKRNHFGNKGRCPYLWMPQLAEVSKRWHHEHPTQSILWSMHLSSLHTVSGRYLYTWIWCRR